LKQLILNMAYFILRTAREKRQKIKRQTNKKIIKTIKLNKHKMFC